MKVVSTLEAIIFRACLRHYRPNGIAKNLANRDRRTPSLAIVQVRE